VNLIRALRGWWHALAQPLPPSPHCRCHDYYGGPYGGAIGDHLCAAGCLIHGPRCGCGLYLVPK
jgi:hypothetical protein